jgi:hypothetical protein
MGFLDRLTEGAEKVAKQAEKALEQGKTKVEELQLERQMDGVAKKLGYLEFDASRGRAADPAVRQSYLDELAALEVQIAQSTEAAAAPGGGDGAATAPAATPPMDPPAEV